MMGDMQAKDHGVFHLYQPTDIPSTHRFFSRPQVLWLKNEKGRDWYDLAHADHAAGRFFVTAHPATGRVASQSQDITTLWPVDARLLETDRLVDASQHWDGEAFVMVGYGPEAVLPGVGLRKGLEFKDEGGGLYRAMRQSICVGQAQVWAKDGKHGIGRSYVRKGFERTGVVSALYQHIAATVGSSLDFFLDSMQSEPWADWAAVDAPPENLLQTIKFVEEANATFYALHDDRPIARAQVWRHPDTLEVSVYRFQTHKDYQRQGVMKALYQHIEAKRGTRLVPMPLHTRTAAGVSFREKFEAERSGV